MALSISRAWDETKATFARDGRLITIVALALIGVPSALAELINPSSPASPAEQTPGMAVIALIVGLIGLVGQLSIIRLAAGPSVTVGESIRHGAARAPAYVGAALVMILGFILLALPLLAVLAALGADVEPPIDDLPPAAALALILFFAIVLYLAVRLLLTGPVASLERLGPIAILRRSWSLTSGQALRLFGFLLLFGLAALFVLGAIGMLAGILAEGLFGDPQPFSASALAIGLITGLLGALASALFVVMVTHLYLQRASSTSDTEVSVPSTSES